LENKRYVISYVEKFQKDIASKVQNNITNEFVIKKSNTNAYQLDKEIHKVVINNKVKSLMSNYVSKRLTVLLAIEKVLSNPGNKTPGIDNILYKKCKTRKDITYLNNSKITYINASVLALELDYSFLKDYNPFPVKRVFIEKYSGKLRSLGILTLKDRVIQELFRLVIDPAIDVISDHNSFGFRKGRSCHQALGLTGSCLHRNSNNQIILDITPFFDEISYDFILDNFPMPTGFENILNK